MSEIEKMYENAGINQVCNTCELRGFKRLCPSKELCVRANPPFTAEKQLELIKFCFEKYRLLGKTRVAGDRCVIYNLRFPDDYPEYIDCATWEEAIAGLINNFWQDLTEIEKVQIKEILDD